MTIRASSCKKFQTLSCLSQLNILNWLSSWTRLDCLAHTFQNHLVAPHTPRKTILWIFFFIKEITLCKCDLLIRRSPKGMWVPSRYKSTYVWQTYQFLKFLNDHLDWFYFGMLIYLLKNLFLLVKTSHIMSTYFWIVDAPQLNNQPYAWHYVHEWIYKKNNYKYLSNLYLWSHKIEALRLQEQN